MPMIRVEMFEGRTVEQKRECARALTRAFVETCGGNPDAIQIVFTDVAKENWAFGGRLGSDPKPEA
ncbi:4-oxalocrotonate tautomerase [Xinfangfangia sp. D13-10-4-6]|uniref:4-oxalocrotonate tautomerase n=1 Tax=Pseudogemmobacter hezensis TaxID=2737662 RepID=UPI0015549F94|nr:4-oxalocrotonate tautomerase [Pseudogemmobacter hezensis]NPD15431.1 4-oxalocrotonate tautomerase [Pseudogemmobacter hezensis]